MKRLFCIVAALLIAAPFALSQGLPGAVQSVTVDCHAGCTNLVVGSAQGLVATTAGNTLVIRTVSNQPVTAPPTDTAGNPWKVCTSPNTSPVGCYAASNGAQYTWTDVVFYAASTTAVSLGNYTFTGAVELDEIAASTATMIDATGSTNVITTSAATTGKTVSLTTTKTNDTVLCALAYPATPTLSGSVTTVNYNNTSASALFASATEATAGTYTCAATWTSTTGSPAVSMIALAVNPNTLALYAPLLSPVTGKYGPTQTVTMGSAGRQYSPGIAYSTTNYAPQASVYYTITAGTTGTTPNCSSTLYNPSSPPTVSVTSTVEAIACMTGLTASAVSKSVITITGVLTPTTYYVLSGGGTQAQCTGKSNAVYPGSGSAQACAWGDFRWSYTSGAYGNNAWVMQGGDTLIVDAATKWRVGFNSGASSTDTTYCDGISNNQCFPPPIPSGTVSQPTQILGSNYASCDSLTSSGTYGPVGPYNGSATNATQLHGGYGLTNVLDLAGSSYVNLECLELTSYNGTCTRTGQAASGGTVACSTTPPYGDYIRDVIFTDPNTSNIVFQDDWIHNGAQYGLYGPFGAGITMSDVLISFNAFAGWDMDNGIGSDVSEPDPIGAGLTQNHVTYYANGCNEAYPTGTGFPAASCFDSGAASGGFGDSWSGQDTYINTFYCNHCAAIYNTKDGDVGPHTYTLYRATLNSQFYGNEGQQQKWGMQPGATVIFENNQVNGNCQRLSSAPPGFTGTWSSIQTLGALCRASGETFAPYSSYNGTLIDANNSITGYGSTIFDFSICDPTNTCGNSAFTFKNNLYNLYSESTFNAGQQPGVYYYLDPSVTLTTTYNLYYNGKTGTFPASETGAVHTSPLLTGQPATPITAETQLDNFNYSLSSSSPAIHVGTPISGLTTDFLGNAWNNPPSMGSLEYFASGSSASQVLSGGITW